MGPASGFGDGGRIGGLVSRFQLAADGIPDQGLEISRRGRAREAGPWLDPVGEPRARRRAGVRQPGVQEVLGRHAEQTGERQQMADPEHPPAGREVVPPAARQRQSLLDRLRPQPGRGDGALEDLAQRFELAGHNRGSLRRAGVHRKPEIHLEGLTGDQMVTYDPRHG